MGYLAKDECEARLAKFRQILEHKDLDLALVYYDEFNIGNGWYLTGWCPQFESGSVLVPRKGTPMILGGPESEPFAKQDSAITDTRNFPVFMVPDEEYPNATIIDFQKLFAELNATLGRVKRVGLVGAGRMPADCHRQIVEGFSGVETDRHHPRIRRAALPEEPLGDRADPRRLQARRRLLRRDEGRDRPGRLGDRGRRRR